jgi:hypothetical protein
MTLVDGTGTHTKACIDPSVTAARPAIQALGAKYVPE